MVSLGRFDCTQSTGDNHEKLLEYVVKTRLNIIRTIFVRSQSHTKWQCGIEVLPFYCILAHCAEVQFNSLRYGSDLYNYLTNKTIIVCAALAVYVNFATLMGNIGN